MPRKHRDDVYQHRRHNKNLLMAHVIFVCKYRKPLFRNKRLSADVKQYIFDICKRKHWYLIRMETDTDHIHILLQYNPTDSISSIVSLLKQYSTYHVWKRHAVYLNNFYWAEKTLWSDGYFACSVGNASKSVIEHYIASQG